MDARGTAHPFRARLQVLGQVPARIPSVAAAAIAIISDTHLPRGNRRLPADCVSRMRAADLIIIHAGDLTTASMLEQLRAIGEVAAVHGNADDAAVRALLPTRLELTVGDVGLGIVHDAGAARGRLGRLRRSFTEAGRVCRCSKDGVTSPAPSPGGRVSALGRSAS
jgi:hypothetical protein